MAIFGTAAIASTGIGAVVFGWVEANPKLEWRWIQWVQYSASSHDRDISHGKAHRLVIMGAFFPIICFIMRETRATVILRRRAAKYRKTLTGFPARFTARSEIEKVKFSVALQQSLMRPLRGFFCCFNISAGGRLLTVQSS
jgi:hypothetical protein